MAWIFTPVCLPVLRSTMYEYEIAKHGRPRRGLGPPVDRTSKLSGPWPSRIPVQSAEYDPSEPLSANLVNDGRMPSGVAP